MRIYTLISYAVGVPMASAFTLCAAAPAAAQSNSCYASTVQAIETTLEAGGVPREKINPTGIRNLLASDGSATADAVLWFNTALPTECHEFTERNIIAYANSDRSQRRVEAEVAGDAAQAVATEVNDATEDVQEARKDVEEAEVAVAETQQRADNALRRSSDPNVSPREASQALAEWEQAMQKLAEELRPELRRAHERLDAAEKRLDQLEEWRARDRRDIDTNTDSIAAINLWRSCATTGNPPEGAAEGATCEGVARLASAGSVRNLRGEVRDLEAREQCRQFGQHNVAGADVDCARVSAYAVSEHEHDSLVSLWLALGLIGLILVIVMLCVYNNWYYADRLPQWRANARLAREEQAARKAAEKQAKAEAKAEARAAKEAAKNAWDEED